MNQKNNIEAKIFIALGVLLLIYSFISVIIPIYFFWESKSFGWFFVFFGLILLMRREIVNRKISHKNNIWLKIGIGFICFLFLIQIILIIVIPNSDAFKEAKKYILESKEIKSEIGEVKSFGFIPSGSISVNTNSQGKRGEANINLILKGEKKYKRVTVFVLKEYGANWDVYNVD